VGSEDGFREEEHVAGKLKPLDVERETRPGKYSDGDGLYLIVKGAPALVPMRPSKVSCSHFKQAVTRCMLRVFIQERPKLIVNSRVEYASLI
jgi:hypothetical protein